MPIPKEEGIRYICFSDIPFEHDTWEFRYAYPFGQTDPRRVARMYKILSHVWFPDEETIWLDGRGALSLPAKQVFDKYRSDTIAIRKHATRTCIYNEAVEVIRINYEDSRVVDNQMRRYAAEGFPVGYGLHETGCLVRGCNENVTSFNTMWWSEVSSASKRDQLSFDYVRFKLGIGVMEMDRNDVYFQHHKIKTDVTH